MAIAKGREVNSQFTPSKKFWGVAPVRVLAINPNKEKLEEIFEKPYESEPTYFTEKEVDGKTVKSLKIDVIVGNDDFKNRVTFFVENRPLFKRDGSKCKMIDPYGRTAWASMDSYKKEAKEQEPIINDNGNPADISTQYRPALRGEEELVAFLKIWLGISRPSIYDKATKSWIPNTKVNIEDCECDLSEYWATIFSKQNTKVLSELSSNNVIKVLFGIKTDGNTGNQYMQSFNKLILTGGNKDYSKLKQKAEEAISFGGYSSTDFIYTDYQEYVVTPSEIPVPQGTITPPEGTISHSAEDSLPF